MVKLTDLVIGKAKEIDATNKALRRRFRGGHGLGRIIQIARDMTDLTGREVSFGQYTHVDNLINSNGGNYVNIVNTQLGDESGVAWHPGWRPRHEYSAEKNIFVPVFYLHTHPNPHPVIASTPDLKLPYSRRRIQMRDGDHEIYWRGKEIFIISGHGFTGSKYLLFYQLTDNFAAYDRFMDKYERIVDSFSNRFYDRLEDLKTTAGKSVPEYEDYVQEEFAQFLNRSGAFKALYHNYTNDKPTVENPIGERIVERVVRKFSYHASISRVK